MSRPVLRYHGGKWKLAPWLISLFPRHRVYVEPFGGAASVLMQKPRSYAEIYNDQWELVVNVFEVLRSPRHATELLRALELTPFSRDEFTRPMRKNASAVERARKTIFRSFAGFGSASVNGDFSTGFRAASNRSGTTPAHDWRNYPPNIVAFVERLRGVVIENRNAIDVIQQHDSLDTLIYCDPPYVHTTRNMRRGNASYACEMSDDDHRALATTLHAARGMVILSGYRCALYDELYGDWKSIDRLAFADGARQRTEVVWMNPAACRAGQAYRPLLHDEAAS